MSRSKDAAAEVAETRLKNEQVMRRVGSLADKVTEELRRLERVLEESECAQDGR